MVNDIEKKLKDDKEDTREALTELNKVRVRIIWLIEQVEIGERRIKSAKGTRDKQFLEMEKLQSLLDDLEKWIQDERKVIKTPRVNTNDESEINKLNDDLKVRKVKNFSRTEEGDEFSFKIL